MNSEKETLKKRLNKHTRAEFENSSNKNSSSSASACGNAFLRTAASFSNSRFERDNNMNKKRNEWRRNLLLIIPAHHIGSYKYEYPPEPGHMKTSSIKQEEIQLKSTNYQNIGSIYIQSPTLNHELNRFNFYTNTKFNH